MDLFNDQETNTVSTNEPNIDEGPENDYICIVAKIQEAEGVTPGVILMVYKPAFDPDGMPNPQLEWVFQMTFAQAATMARMTQAIYGPHEGENIVLDGIKTSARMSGSGGGLLENAGGDYTLVVGFSKIAIYLDPDEMLALANVLLEFVQSETLKAEYKAHTMKRCGPACKFCAMLAKNQTFIQ